MVTNVEHYSFFPPLVTVSPGLAPFVLPMPSVPVLKYAFGFMMWVLMLDQLLSRVRAAGGRPAIRRVLRDAFTAARLIPGSAGADPKPR